MQGGHDARAAVGGMVPHAHGRGRLARPRAKLFDTDEQASRHAAAVAMRYRNTGYEDADPCWEPCDNDGIPIFL